MTGVCAGDPRVPIFSQAGYQSGITVTVATPPPPDRSRERARNADVLAAHRATLASSVSRDGDTTDGLVSRPGLEVENAPDLILQRNGQLVTSKTIRELAAGRVGPETEGEAGELVRWLWEVAATGGGMPSQLTGWQAVAWLATRDEANVRRLLSRIEFLIGPHSHDLLPYQVIERCLRWAASQTACRCGEPTNCKCVDFTFSRLNVALRTGRIVDLRSQSTGPMNSANADHFVFQRAQIEALFGDDREPGTGS